jgi:hypothetical protein
VSGVWLLVARCSLSILFFLIIKGAVTTYNMGYYDFFVSEANDGYVFDSDMSSMQTAADRLTALEAKERRDWNKSFADIRKHYMGKNLKAPKVISQEGVLQQRLIAPRMEPNDVTRRTGMTESRAGRMYPHPTHLAVWDDAESNVANYRLSTAPITDMYPRQFEVFHLMMIHGNKKGYRSEDKELEFLLNGLDFLTAAKIVGEIEREVGTVGKPDFTLKGYRDRIGIIVEGRARTTC